MLVWLGSLFEIESALLVSRRLNSREAGTTQTDSAEYKAPHRKRLVSPSLAAQANVRRRSSEALPSHILY